MIRVLVVDDHAILNAGVQALILSQPDLAVAGSAPDGETGIELIRAERPDVVVMDLSMPGMGGLAAIRAIVDEDPDARILVLTWHADPARVRAALAAGAKGYVLKDADHGLLLDAIRAVAQGEVRLSPQVMDAVAM